MGVCSVPVCVSVSVSRVMQIKLCVYLFLLKKSLNQLKMADYNYAVLLFADRSKLSSYHLHFSHFLSLPLSHFLKIFPRIQLMSPNLILLLVSYSEFHL